MEPSTKKGQSWRRAAAASGVAAACAVCCLSLPAVAAFVAGIGLSGFAMSSSNWTIPFIAAVFLIGIGLLSALRRKKVRRQAENDHSPKACFTSCYLPQSNNEVAESNADSNCCSK